MTQKIQYLEAKNLGPIESATADFTQGQILLVKALNGQGKSWFGETLFDLLKNKLPGTPLREGEHEGYFRAVLENGSEILYKFDLEGQKLEFYLPGKKPMTQAQQKVFISDLLGHSKKGFDLTAYLAETQPKKRSQMLAKLVGLDFTVINTRISMAIEERVVSGRNLTNVKAKADDPRPIEILKRDMNLELPDASKIQAEVESMIKANNDRDLKFAEAKKAFETVVRYTDGVTAYENEVKELEAKIEVLKGKIETGKRLCETTKTEAENLTAQADAMHVFTEEQIQEPKKKLDEIGMLHHTKITARQALNMLADVEVSEKEWEAADAKVKQYEAEKMELISNCNVIPGLTFTPEGDAIWNGRPIEESSTGEQVIFGIEIKKKEAGDLRFMHIDCHALDGVNIRKVAEHMAQDGWTCLLEIPEQISTESGLKVEVIPVKTE